MIDLRTKIVHTTDVIVLSVLVVISLCSCTQRINKVEFYEPTAVNAPYCTKASDKSMGYGPIKSIEGKSGSPDFSDHKSFSVKLNVIGI